MNAAVEAAFDATIRRLASPAWADDLFFLPKPVSIELDGLAENTPQSQWSVAQQIAFTALRFIEPRHKLAVLSMASNEAPHLTEWIAHHLAIGAEKIFIYTNNNDDGTDELLHWFSHNAPVVPITVGVARGINVQQKNYNHALFLLPELRLYDWVAVLDVDEFLLPDVRYEHNLRAMIDAAPVDTETILLPWHWRIWPRDFARGQGLLAERFSHAVHHEQIKCVTRLRHVISLAQVHFPEYDRPVTIRDSAFEVIERKPWWHLNLPGTGAWVEHFWGKSFEEFLIKQRRGETMGLRDKLFQHGMEHFFQWTQLLTPNNAAHWPDGMLRATKAKLAEFAAKPGFAMIQQMVESRYAAYAAKVRNDPDLRAIYDEMLTRFPL